MENRHRYRWLLPVAALAVALPSFAGAGVAMADVQPSAASGNAALVPHRQDAVSPDIQVDPAVVYLSVSENISEAEALRRVKLQPLVSQFSQLAEATDPAFAGVWIDQDHGGTIVAQSTTVPDLILRSAIDKSGLEGVDIKEVKFTLSELRNISNELTNRITRADGTSRKTTFEVDVNTRQNAVFLTVRGDATSLTAEQRNVLDFARTQQPVVVNTTNTQVRPAACSNFYGCDPPLHGGVAIESTSSSGCTGGFNFVSNSSGNEYQMTAGHCGTSDWTYKIGNGSFHSLGITKTQIYGSGPGMDEESIKISDTTYWGFSNYIYKPSYIYNGTYHAEVKNYAITGEVVGAVEGDVVCRSGAVSSVACGKITDDSASVTYDSYTHTDMLKTTGSMCKGDSGGPVFALHRAYGQAVAVGGAQTAVVPTPWPDIPSTRCYAGPFYSVRIDNIENAMNVSLY